VQDRSWTVSWAAIVEAPLCPSLSLAIAHRGKRRRPFAPLNRGDARCCECAVEQLATQGTSRCVIDSVPCQMPRVDSKAALASLRRINAHPRSAVGARVPSMSAFRSADRRDLLKSFTTHNPPLAPFEAAAVKRRYQKLGDFCFVPVTLPALSARIRSPISSGFRDALSPGTLRGQRRLILQVQFGHPSMPRYFFHLEGGPKGGMISDKRGQVFAR
jgi:hypothetical protein